MGVGRHNDGENDPRGTRTQRKKRSAPTFPTHARSRAGSKLGETTGDVECKMKCERNGEAKGPESRRPFKLALAGRASTGGCMVVT